VIKDLTVKTTLANEMAVAFARSLAKDKIPQDDIEKRITRSRERITTAPVVIILSLDMSEMDVYPDTERKKAEYLMTVQSVANAGMQMLLAAHAEGLGSVWVCSPLFVPKIIQKILDMPDTWEPQAMFFLGYPKITPEPREKKSIDEITKHF